MTAVPVSDEKIQKIRKKGKCSHQEKEGVRQKGGGGQEEGFYVWDAC